MAKYSKDPRLHHVVVAPFAVNHLSQARIGTQHGMLDPLPPSLYNTGH